MSLKPQRDVTQQEREEAHNLLMASSVTDCSTASWLKELEETSLGEPDSTHP